MIRHIAIYVCIGLVSAGSAALADETTDPSYTPNRGDPTAPAPPQMLEVHVSGEPVSEPSQTTSDDGMLAARESLLGKTVVTVEGDEIGVVRDVGYSSAYGEPVAVVAIDAFIGIGEKQIAIPFSQLQSGDSYSTSIMTLFTRDAVEAEDAFDEADFTAIE